MGGYYVQPERPTNNGTLSQTGGEGDLTLILVGLIAMAAAIVRTPRTLPKPADQSVNNSLAIPPRRPGVTRKSILTRRGTTHHPHPHNKKPSTQSQPQHNQQGHATIRHRSVHAHTRIPIRTTHATRQTGNNTCLHMRSHHATSTLCGQTQHPERHACTRFRLGPATG